MNIWSSYLINSAKYDGIVVAFTLPLILHKFAWQSYRGRFTEQQYRKDSEWNVFTWPTYPFHISRCNPSAKIIFVSQTGIVTNACRPSPVADKLRKMSDSLIIVASLTAKTVDRKSLSFLFQSFFFFFPLQQLCWRAFTCTFMMTPRHTLMQYAYVTSLSLIAIAQSLRFECRLYRRGELACAETIA